MYLSHNKLLNLDYFDVKRYWKPNNYYDSLKSNNNINHDITIPEVQKNIVYTKKVRIYPTFKQKELFNKFIGANRHFFNKTNDYIKNNPDDKRRFDHKYMRLKMLHDHTHDWYDEIPYDTKSLAVQQCTAAYKSALTNLRNGNIDHFDIGFLNKKQTNQVFYVDTGAYNFKKSYIFSRRLKDDKSLRTKEPIDKTKCSNLVILKTKPGKWFICIPNKKDSNYLESDHEHVFIDPGSRTFLTCYNPKSGYLKLGDGFANQELMPLGKKVDKLQSVRSKAKGRKRRNLNLKMAKIRNHMKNKVTDLHRKCCNYLTTTYQNIYLPYLDTIQISDTVERNISSKAVRNIMSLSHGAFRVRLEHVVKTKQRNLFYVPESYTTKTCPCCGSENEIGAATKHVCKCGYSGDRDETAALNICISTLCLC